MGISVYPQPSSGKSQRFAVFNSSGTWTAPTSSSYDGLVTLFAVGGGGGGGGGGAGAPSTSNTQGRPGGCSGGGGGGGQVLREVTVAVPAGTVVPVTIGAGGTGGQLDTTAKTINYFLNPNIRNNANGYSAVTNVNSLQRDTSQGGYGTQFPWGISNPNSLYFTNTNQPAAFSFRYDTGNDAFTVDSGSRGYRIRAAYSRDESSRSFSVTTTVVWYNNTTEIRTDTYSNTFTTPSTSGQWNSVTLYSNSSTPIPTNANRFVMTVSLSGTQSNTSMRWNSFTLSPFEYSISGSASNGNPEYVDGSISYSGNQGVNPTFWNGTADASVTKFRVGAGGATNPGNSYNFAGGAGIAGTRGGNTSFGSYLVAYGGGAGMGGGAMNATYSGSWNYGNSIHYDFTGDSNNRYGGNGGGAGGSSGGQSPTQNRGGGGGGAGGWAGTNVSGSFGLDYTGSSAQSSASTSIIVATFGGAPLNNLYAPGGSSGGSGAQAQSSTSTSTVTQSGQSGNGSGNPLWLGTLGGNGGSSSGPVLGGVTTSGSNGANATLVGGGGGGGGGGGSSTSTTNGGSTYANSGNGGNGGNGAAGILIASWWE